MLLTFYTIFGSPLEKKRIVQSQNSHFSGVWFFEREKEHKCQYFLSRIVEVRKEY
jgi:DICT domain-containing protein